jgi:uncharacterized protein DUF998
MKGWLVCGFLSSLLYAAMNLFVPLLYEGYSLSSQTVSELSAIGAPTRTLWVWLGALFSLLVIGFGWGLWKSAGTNRALRALGAVTVINGAFMLYFPPMQMRGAEFALTDAMHIAWTVVTLLLMLLAMGFGAAALGRRFRLYSIATMAILLAFGTLAGLDGPRVQANLPTPWVGVWQRIAIAAFLAWVLVLNTILLRRART